MRHTFRVLVIEDEPQVRDMLQRILEHEGFQVDTACDGIEGLRTAYQTHPDIILLDVMLPEMDGFEACCRIRELTDTPVLIMTGKAKNAEDITRGFSAGADDYITKPFNHDELISRIYARLRNTGADGDEGGHLLSPCTSVVLDTTRRELILKGRTTYLPPKEFQVLQLLVRYAGQTLTPAAILAQVWGPSRSGSTDLVKQYIYRLRQRIEPDPTAPRYIHSVRNGGYYFAPPNEEPGQAEP